MEQTEILDSEEAAAARDAANAYVRAIPRHKLKIRKLLLVAFHPNTSEPEATAAMLQARKLMGKDSIEFLEIMRADWGGGPLVAAISQVGHMTMTAGKYMGRPLAWIIQEDPGYIAHTVEHGWRAGDLLDAMKLMHNAYMTELVCRYTGEWDNPDIVEWDS